MAGAVQELRPVAAGLDHRARGAVDRLAGGAGAAGRASGGIGRQHQLVDPARLGAWLAQRDRAGDIRGVAIAQRAAVHNDQVARLEGALAVAVVRVGRIRPARDDRAERGRAAGHAHLALPDLG